MGLLSLALSFQSCWMPAAAFLLALWVIPRSSLMWLYWLVNQVADGREDDPTLEGRAGRAFGDERATLRHDWETPYRKATAPRDAVRSTRTIPRLEATRGTAMIVKIGIFGRIPQLFGPISQDIRRLGILTVLGTGFGSPPSPPAIDRNVISPGRSRDETP